MSAAVPHTQLFLSENESEYTDEKRMLMDDLKITHGSVDVDFTMTTQMFRMKNYYIILILFSGGSQGKHLYWRRGNLRVWPYRVASGWNADLTVLGAVGAPQIMIVLRLVQIDLCGSVRIPIHLKLKIVNDDCNFYKTISRE